MLTQARWAADPAPLAISAIVGLAAVAAQVPSQPKGSHHVAPQHCQKHPAGYATEKDCKTQEDGPSLEGAQDQAGDRPRTAQAS